MNCSYKDFVAFCIEMRLNAIKAENEYLRSAYEKRREMHSNNSDKYLTTISDNITDNR